MSMEEKIPPKKSERTARQPKSGPLPPWLSEGELPAGGPPPAAERPARAGEPGPPSPGKTRPATDVRWLTDLGVVYFRQHQFGEAFRCFQRAAEQGFATAEFCLAVCHFNGHGTRPDDAAALAWLRKAAAKGDANAEFTLGLAYRLGRGLTEDEKEAAQWLERAAGHGHHQAILEVEKMKPTVKTLEETSSPKPAAQKVPRLGHDLQQLILSMRKKK